MFKILEHTVLCPKVHSLIIDAPLIAGKAQAGQFVMVKLSEEGERIPLTISDFDRDRGVITVVFQEAGRTTVSLAAKQKGEFIPDLLGPQGNPTDIGQGKRVCVIGGGIGVAPAYLLAKAVKEKQCEVLVIAGYRSKEFIFWEDKLASVSDKLIIATNDGSYGQKGQVTDVLAQVLSADEKIDQVFAIGPTMMMKAVAEVTRPYKVKTTVSLNALMVCGMGMCGACRVTVEGKTRFTCMDGPDFDAFTVNFDELMTRLKTYTDEERKNT